MYIYIYISHFNQPANTAPQQKVIQRLFKPGAAVPVASTIHGAVVYLTLFVNMFAQNIPVMLKKRQKLDKTHGASSKSANTSD
jgi:hypothetical protein